MTISIALCTYNGEKYLAQQLDSLLCQTRLPNQVVIGDDGSTDATVSIIQDFQQRAPFEVKFILNTPALRTVKNFENTAQHCTSDVVFFCDQDDYWLPTKIQTLVEHLITNPQTNAVFCDATLVNQHLEPLGQTTWEKVRFWQQQQQQWQQGHALDVLLHGNRVSGCMLAIRRGFLEKMMPFPTHIDDFIHDAWLAMGAAYLDSIDFISQPLILYRQHSNQQVGVQSKTKQKVTLRSRWARDREEKLTPLRQKVSYYEALGVLLVKHLGVQQNAIQKVQRVKQIYATRSTLPNNRFMRLLPITRCLVQGGYHKTADIEAKWTAPYLTALGDIFE